MTHIHTNKQYDETSSDQSSRDKIIVFFFSYKTLVMSYMTLRSAVISHASSVKSLRSISFALNIPFNLTVAATLVSIRNFYFYMSMKFLKSHFFLSFLISPLFSLDTFLTVIILSMIFAMRVMKPHTLRSLWNSFFPGRTKQFPPLRVASSSRSIAEKSLIGRYFPWEVYWRLGFWVKQQDLSTWDIHGSLSNNLWSWKGLPARYTSYWRETKVGIPIVIKNNEIHRHVWKQNMTSNTYLTTSFTFTSMTLICLFLILS